MTTLERRVETLEKQRRKRSTTLNAKSFITRIRHWATELGKQQEEHTSTLDPNDPSDLIFSALILALKDYPNEFKQVFACLLDGRLGDARDVLARCITDNEGDGNVLTPRAVGGVLHMLMHGALDSSAQNVADRIRAPLLEYCGDDTTLQDTIVLLLYDLISDYMVFRDYPVAFGLVCLNDGHGFHIDGRHDKS
ncbi:MAG: hypothetical protein ACXVIB_03800 [Halobacteriota archaeon]